ncbi:MAG TPA: aldehyde ferredoxin oxidoreductase [Anaerolineae bacterium]|nr:aldehyde ferredoxin oxidoreductase [Anaerolineae bacterium]
MATYGGWTGKILRVDLTSGKITAEETLPKYKDWMGGSGLAYKIIWDEVPVGTKAYDPQNVIVLGGGPLTGSGAPTGGRCTITSLFPSTKGHPVASGHMGGHWAPELKFAGWDAVVVTGQSAKPVWLCIEDDKVTLRDANKMWGNGIFRTTAEVCELMGNDAHVAAIGQAGENMVNQAVIMCDRSHSAGGLGGVMGSKGLKAIGVRGTGAVQMAASPQEWRELVRYMLSLLGANNQGVVPTTPQPWAEYHNSGTRWTAREDLFWGAAQPPIELGDCPAEDLNKIGYRTHKGVLDFRTKDPGSGRSIGELITVRMGGCHSCPIRCHILIDLPSMETKYGLPRYSSNTCSGWQGGQMYPKNSEDPWIATETKVLGSILADDYGVWNNYGLTGSDFSYAYKEGIIKQVLSEEEYESIPWDLLDAGDPRFQFEYFRRIAYKIGELGEAMGEGSAYLQERWNFPEEWKLVKKHWKLGHPYHHSIENAGQVGVMINLVYNRDPNTHTHSNFYGAGLPIEVMRELSTEVFGHPDAVDVEQEWTPMNEGKAVFGKLTYAYMELHNSMTLCNYTLPIWASPLKERNYRGDPTLDAQLYSAVTGDQKTREELEDLGIKHLTMLRALTMRSMGTVDMRNEHDLVPDWAFDYPGWAEEKPFTPGHDKMDRDDVELTKDLFYAQLGWDTETGAPTRETLQKYDMKDVADGLAKAGLLPA